MCKLIDKELSPQLEALVFWIQSKVNCHGLGFHCRSTRLIVLKLQMPHCKPNERLHKFLPKSFISKPVSSLDYDCILHLKFHFIT